MGKLLWVAWLCAIVQASEPDGAVAAPARWTGPNGPASHSRRSRAMPVTRDVVEAWSVALPGQALAPPVTWDGMAYVLCQARRGAVLVGVDIARGRLVAKKVLPKAAAAPIHVWGGVVYAVTSPNQLTGLRRSGKTFVEGWKYRHKDFQPSGMVVIENEIFVVSNDELLRLAPGSGKYVVWRRAKQYRGPPAVFGECVLVLGHKRLNREPVATLYALRRSDGTVASVARVLWYSSASPGITEQGGITVGSQYVVVEAPRDLALEGSRARHAFVPYARNGRSVSLSDANAFMDFRIQPAAYKGGLITCEKATEWQWWVGKRGRVLAQHKFNPDLFAQLVPPTVMGDVAYFGTWAADVETGEILWRLPVRAVAFGAVPADRLVLVVDLQKTLRAFKSRVGK
ncbi:MAG: outer membrane protein assembly factor BamB family protein [Planctomycetota bacterium]|jgi:outer membrane protein assembly factor BamB